MDIALNPDGTSPIETFAFADGTTYTLNDLLITTQTWYGDKKANTLITGRNDDTVYRRQRVAIPSTAARATTPCMAKRATTSSTAERPLYGDKGNDNSTAKAATTASSATRADDYLNGGCGNDSRWR